VYEVIITDGSGCSKTERITVVERCEARVFVPDAFSPNGEGVSENETFKISGQYVTDSRIIIYNRWGEVVYTAEDILNSANFWDGTYLGQPAPIGSYAYKITYKSADYPDREPTVLRGGVMLLR
jgi:gliding motility-associated-like protein